MIGFLFNAALGAATVFAFAPYRLWWLPIITLAWFFARILSATSVRRAFLTGLAFGLGLFGLGVSWVYVALNTFGKMPALLAALATALFCAYLALFPALAAALTRWVARRGGGAWVAAVGFFVAAEWLRGVLFSGFPWLMMGSAVVGDTPLSGFAPIVGGYGLSFVVCGLAALLAWALPRVMPTLVKICAAGILIAVVMLIGNTLRATQWSKPASSTPIAISLVQGNIAQDLKFQPQALAQNAARYDALIAKAKGRLVILPETAIVTPLRLSADPAITRLGEAATRDNRTIIFGAPIVGDDGLFSNAAIATDGRTVQTYRKQHLVPFGEYMPLRAVLGWFYDNVAIPLAGFTPGAANQSPLNVQGEKLGLSICYEDVFSDALRSQAIDATILVNITNDAWYGYSWAALQHAQLAQLRAAEFARPLVRATNTGMTVVIDHRGVEMAHLPWFTEGILETQVVGRAGLTPFAAYGDLPLLLVLLAIIGIAIARRLQSRND